MSQNNLSIDKIVENIHLRNKYFQAHSNNDNLFLIEFEISQLIINIIGTGINLEEHDLFKIVNTYNNIINQNHYNGSGWFDFKIILNSFFNYYDYFSEWDKNTDELKIKKIKLVNN